MVKAPVLQGNCFHDPPHTICPPHSCRDGDRESSPTACRARPCGTWLPTHLHNCVATLTPNAGGEPPPVAGATEGRELSGGGSPAWFGAGLDRNTRFGLVLR